MLVERTAKLLCPLALTDMSYSGIAASPSPVPPSTASASEDSEDGEQIVLIVVIVALVVAMLLVCGFTVIMYTKEKAGEPMFKPLPDMDPDGPPKEDCTASVEIVSKDDA